MQCKRRAFSCVSTDVWRRIGRGLRVALPLLLCGAGATAANVVGAAAPQALPAGPVVKPLGLQQGTSVARRSELPLGAELPNDPYSSAQWNLHSPDNVVGASGLFAVQPLLPDARQLVIAVVDSGFLLSHLDLDLLPGYDFVSDLLIANDGDGRDSDPSDPGDWIDEQDQHPSRLGAGCVRQESSWHGTGVAGIIGARSSNNIGIAGATLNASLLPVRVTGKCGGYVADLVDGLRWSAGLPVAGIAANATPAQVINVSLGFPGACPRVLQAAIDEAVLHGAIVVTAATNSAANLDEQPYAPASCNNVLTAGAVTKSGGLAYYSAWGAALDLLAPGGDSIAGIITTDNAGTTVPVPGSDYNYRYGTSLSSAHLAAAVAGMLSLQPDLSLARIGALLRAGSTPIDEIHAACQLQACGAGILNARRSVQLLLDGAPVTEQTDPVVASGQAPEGVQLDPQSSPEAVSLIPAGDGVSDLEVGSLGLTAPLLLSLALWRAVRRRRD